MTKDDMQIEELRNEGWWADDGRTGCFVVPFEDVQEYIVKLKLQFEERLAHETCEAFDDGYLSAFHPNQE